MCFATLCLAICRRYLSAMINEGWGPTHMVLVERKAYRFKVTREYVCTIESSVYLQGQPDLQYERCNELSKHSVCGVRKR